MRHQKVNRVSSLKINRKVKKISYSLMYRSKTCIDAKIRLYTRQSVENILYENSHCRVKSVEFFKFEVSY